MIICSNSYWPWHSTIPSLLLQNCKTQADVNQIHARLITTGYIANGSLTNKIILHFISSPRRPLVEFARHVFFTRHAVCVRPCKVNDPFLWNAVIKSYSHGDDPEEAFYVLCRMLEYGISVDKFSFSLVLKACARVCLVKEGNQIHGFLKKLELGSNLFLLNCLISWYLRCADYGLARQVFDRMPTRDSVSYNSMIDVYVKAGMIDNARQLFDSMPMEEKNLISWNTLIRGYAQSKDTLKVALELFERMPEKDLVSWNTMIDGCAKCGRMKYAQSLFDQMPERDIISWSNMINGYAKLGEVGIARHLFDKMPEKDVVACNAMMAGYAQNGHFKESFEVFHYMQKNRFLPDEATLVVLLSVIAQLGHVENGLSIHHYLEENGMSSRGRLGVALIDMYSKCGSIDIAMKIFEDSEEKGIDHWNAMIGGLAIHGLGDLAFNMLLEMSKLCVKPDDLTYIGVLNACGHAGMVKEGMICFELMRRVHKIEPKLQHFGCVVDFLGRAGLVEEAWKFTKEMPVKPNEVIWRTLVSACQNHEEITIRSPVADQLDALDSFNAGSYVLLSNIYAGLGMWDDVIKVRAKMKKRNMVKLPGCSWIELDGKVHRFFVRDESHPHLPEIYSVLDNFSTQVGDCRC